MKEILDVIHKTIYQFFDVCGDDEEVPISDKDKLLLEVNKAICDNLKALDQESNTWSLDDAREDFMYDVYNTLDFLPTNEEANRIIDSFDRVTSSIEQELALDKIRADIGKSKTEHEMQIAEGDIKAKSLISHIYCDIINIFDKYMAESKRARK